jgi:hypothetical protein
VRPEEMSVARQWVCKDVSTQPNHVTAAADIIATVEEILEVACESEG